MLPLDVDTGLVTQTASFHWQDCMIDLLSTVATKINAHQCGSSPGSPSSLGSAGSSGPPDFHLLEVWRLLCMYLLQLQSASYSLLMIENRSILRHLLKIPADVTLSRPLVSFLSRWRQNKIAE